MLTSNKVKLLNDAIAVRISDAIASDKELSELQQELRDFGYSDNLKERLETALTRIDNEIKPQFRTEC